MTLSEDILKTSGTHLIVHCYSNNGIWSLAGLCRHLDVRPNRVIFDSSPMLYSFTESLRFGFAVKLSEVVVSSMVYGESRYWHPVVSPLVIALLYPLVQVNDQRAAICRALLCNMLLLTSSW